MTWTMNQTQQLTIEQPQTTWIAPELIRLAEKIAEALRITGSQTLTDRSPSDENSDYLGFDIVLNSVHATGVTHCYVLDDSQSVAKRPSSIAEALAELAHSAAFGDHVDEEKLIRLLGDAKARALLNTAASHP